MTREADLKKLICSICHVAILRPHPEENLSNTNFFKCPLCGYTKQIDLHPNRVTELFLSKKNGNSN